MMNPGIDDYAARDHGAVMEEVERLNRAAMHLDKAFDALRERLTMITVDRDSGPYGPSGEVRAIPTRCNLASTVSGEVDHLEEIARRADDLLAAIDL